jgi:hypothetical protein
VLPLQLLGVADSSRFSKSPRIPQGLQIPGQSSFSNAGLHPRIRGLNGCIPEVQRRKTTMAGPETKPAGAAVTTS